MQRRFFAVLIGLSLVSPAASGSVEKHACKTAYAAMMRRAMSPGETVNLQNIDIIEKRRKMVKRSYRFDDAFQAPSNPLPDFFGDSKNRPTDYGRSKPVYFYEEQEIRVGNGAKFFSYMNQVAPDYDFHMVELNHKESLVVVQNQSYVLKVDTSSGEYTGTRLSKKDAISLLSREVDSRGGWLPSKIRALSVNLSDQQTKEIDNYLKTATQLGNAKFDFNPLKYIENARAYLTKINRPIESYNYESLAEYVILPIVQAGALIGGAGTLLYFYLKFYIDSLVR